MKPILFNAEMVRAILNGRKSVTRRVVRGAWPDWNYLELTHDAAVTAVDRYGEEYPKPVDGLWSEFEDADGPVEFPMIKAPYRPGDILYVRETWFKDVGRYMYRADYGDTEKFYAAGREITIRWRPSIHMPKEAARIFLRVTGVRVERLQEVTDREAEKEGVGDLFYEEIGFGNKDYGCVTYLDSKGVIGFQKEQFAHLWDSTIRYPYHPRYGWEANPWVWVIEFERCEKPERVRE